MAWFATAALALACFQLLTAAWIFRKLPIPRPRWVPALHRWSGRVAFACTLPVAYHCIFKLGFQTTTTRVLVHSFLGCAVYGAFASKVLIVRLHRFPRWVLPTAGGLLFATLLSVWYATRSGSSGSSAWGSSDTTGAVVPEENRVRYPHARRSRNRSTETVVNDFDLIVGTLTGGSDRAGNSGAGLGAAEVRDAYLERRPRI
jgi:hypothetical protein